MNMTTSFASTSNRLISRIHRLLPLSLIIGLYRLLRMV